MKQHIAVEHNKTVQQMFTREPQRIQTARLFKTRVDDERCGVLVQAPDSFRFKTKHDDDFVYPGLTQRFNLAREQCLTANFEKAFRLQIVTVQPCPFAGRKYDRFHLVVLSNQTPARNWLPPVLPSFFYYSSKEPKAELTLKRRDLIAAHSCRNHLQKRLEIRAKHVPRNTGDMRHGLKIDLGAFRRLHVEAFSLVKERATDAVPVIPPAEILFI